MKNREANRQVLKAISIGLSAALSLMPTVTVLADDDVDQSGGETSQSQESSDSSQGSSDDGANDEVQEAVSEAAGSLDTAESFCEPSEAGSGEIAAAGEGSDAYVFSSEVYDLLESSEQAVGDIGNDLTALDGLNSATEQANEAAKAALGEDDNGVVDYTVVSTPVSAAESRVDEAKESVKGAVSSVDDTAGKVEESAEKTETAAAVVYDNEGSAQTAKDEALQDLDDANLLVEESRKSVSEAQGKLETANTALGVAQDAVDTAAGKLEEAKKAEKAAQDKLDELHDKWDFTIDEDGKVVFGSKPEDENSARKAIESVSDALIQAQDETAQAGDDLVEAKKNAEDAAKEVAEAAKAKKEAADGAYQTFVENAGSELPGKLDTMLEEIEAQRQIVKEVAGTGNTDNFWKANRNLAYSIVRYTLTLEGNTVPSLDEIGGQVQKKNNGFEVKYVDKDGVQHTEYYNYKAYYKDGDMVGSKGRNSLVDTDHIIVLKKSADGKTEDLYISDAALINGCDMYQSLKKAVADADKEYEQANSAVLGYTDVETAKANLAKAEAAAERLSFLNDERVGDRAVWLMEKIEEQQAKTKSDYETGHNAQTYWKNNRVLTQYLVEYKMLQRIHSGEIESFEFELDNKGALSWVNANSTSSHYCAVTVIKNGQEIKEYYDYIAYYDDGEVAGGSGSYNDMAKYGKDPDHIVVVKKDAPASVAADGKLVFDKKGEGLISVADVFADKADKAAVDNARIAVGLAAIEEAKQKVIEAVKALENAKVVGAESAKEFNRLKEELKTAQEDYAKAKEDLASAQEKLADAEELVEKMSVDIEEGFKYRTPAPNKGQSSGGGSENRSSSDESDEGSSVTDDVSGGGYAPVVDIISSTAENSEASEPGAGGIESAGAVFENIGGTSSEIKASAKPGAFADISGTSSGASSGVLTEDILLEDDVLGQRMAPIIDAVENGTFTRGMMFTEDGLKVDFAWWLVIVLFGAGGVRMYIKKRKKALAKAEK